MQLTSRQAQAMINARESRAFVCLNNPDSERISLTAPITDGRDFVSNLA